MDRNYVIAYAKLATAPEWWDEGSDQFHMGMDFQRFAHLIVSHVAEECAKVCELTGNCSCDDHLKCAAAIRSLYKPTA